MKSSKQAALASRQRTRLSSFRQQRSQEAETPDVTELRQKAQSNLVRAAAPAAPRWSGSLGDRKRWNPDRN